MNDLSRDRIVGALDSVWSSVADLCAGLTDDEWATPSPLPGWDVRDNVIHMLGTEAMLSGRQPTAQVDADSVDHVRNPIGAANEAWIASYADASDAEVLAEFRSLTAQRLEVLRAMSDDEWEQVGFTPAGEGPYGRFMQIRVFDCWMHEQDIRAAVGRPGHDAGPAVEVSLDEMATAMGFVVGKKAAAPDGSSVTFGLTGPAARQIHVRVEGRAAVVASLDAPATATLTMPVVSFSRVAGGRNDAPEHAQRCEISGDAELGQRVLANLSYTI
jgi:uncharacterized protein (TIGR03083 family)